MKKDRKWFIDKWTKERNKTDAHDPMYHFINEFIADVSQLDEPEAKQINELDAYNDELIRDNNQLINTLDGLEFLSKEWIDEHVIDGHNVNLGDKVVYADELDKVLVPKYELPVIPKYVADWIEDIKSKKINLLESIYDFTHGEDIHDCMREQGNVLMRAWLDGYKVEKEPLYCALVKGHELSGDEFKYWNCTIGILSILLSIGSKESEPPFFNAMTKRVWNSLGINDSNADFIEVEELE